MATDLDEDLGYEDETATEDEGPARPVMPWDAWQWWKKGAAAVAVVVLGMTLLGTCRGDGNKKAAPPASTTTTVAVDEIIKGLPQLSPLVAATVKGVDFQQFVNSVNGAIADGTSVCDVYFGFIRETKPNGESKVTWSITTPNMQKRSNVGVQLPSSTWPTKAFYGAPCNVPEHDVALVTTTSAAGVAGKAG